MKGQVQLACLMPCAAVYVAGTVRLAKGLNRIVLPAGYAVVSWQCR